MYLGVSRCIPGEKSPKLVQTRILLPHPTVQVFKDSTNHQDSTYHQNFFQSMMVIRYERIVNVSINLLDIVHTYCICKN